MAKRVQSVERAVDVLDCFIDSAGEVSLTEISRRVGLSKSVVHRILASLKHKGLVVQNKETYGYALGIKVLELAQARLEQFDLNTVALPFMRHLHKATSQSVSIYIREDTHRVAIEHLEGRHEIRFISQIGKPLPLHCGAVGRVLLADLSEAEVDAILGSGPFTAYTDRTITDLAQYKEYLAQVRKDGFAVSYGERVAGSYGIAAPIRDTNGLTVAALAVLGAQATMSEGDYEHFRQLLVQTAQDISAALAQR